MSDLGDATACHCVLDEPPDDRSSWDETSQKLVGDVERHGWGIVGINGGTGDDAGQSPLGWAFTVGLWHTFRSPEVAMFGLTVRDMQLWLNELGEQVRAGNALQPGEMRGGVLDHYPVTFKAVDPEWCQDFFGFALWFAQRPPLPMVQLVWPDREGYFPWDVRCSERCRFDQPRLWLPKADHPMGSWLRAPSHDWPFPDSPDLTVATTKGIAFERRSVVHVVHDDDGMWYFLDGHDASGETLVGAPFDQVVGAHPRVAELGDLASGWEAWRPPAGGPWTRRQLGDDVER